MANRTDSLMRKTKMELVNIILRKDETETELSSKISELEKEVISFTRKNNELTEQLKYNNVRLNDTENVAKQHADKIHKLEIEVNGYRDALDDNASYIQELKNKNKILKIIISALAMIGIALACVFKA